MALHTAQLVALGASTPLGRDVSSTAAAVRAKVTAFSEHPYIVDSVGAPVRAALASWLDVDCDITERLAIFLSSAIQQVVERLPRESSSLKLALALALPPPRPGLPADLDRTIRRSLADRFPNRFARVATFPQGHAAAVLALRAACDRMAEGTFDGCVVAGVDSYINVDTLEWLDQTDQLHGAGPRNNAWGFIPGEGAGALLVLTNDAASEASLPVLGKILATGSGVEAHRNRTETICLGEGLTAAFRDALAGLPPAALVTDIYCDMNGDPYRADEFGFACLRTKEAFVSASDFVAPADCWGDVSAASVPLSIMLATVAAQKDFANGSYSFVWSSSDGAERGAVLLEHPEA
jgi:3-oxoacyl-[acyl-carrier-protein] synthase-1